MQTRLLYASITGSGNDIAHIDMPRSGSIVLIDWSVSVSTFASGDTIGLELSNSSATQATTNESQSVLSFFLLKLGFTTSGAVQNADNKVVPCRFGFKAGDRIYMHAPTFSGTLTAICRAIVHLDI